MTIKMISREDRPDFRSMAKATWRDVNGKENQRYVIQPMQPGPGFKVIDTENNANSLVREYLETIEDAQRVFAYHARSLVKEMTAHRRNAREEFTEHKTVGHFF